MVLRVHRLSKILTGEISWYIRELIARSGVLMALTWHWVARVLLQSCTTWNVMSSWEGASRRNGSMFPLRSKRRLLIWNRSSFIHENGETWLLVAAPCDMRADACDVLSIQMQFYRLCRDANFCVFVSSIQDDVSRFPDEKEPFLSSTSRRCKISLADSVIQ